jgi:CubicO group peptidase (beta-lactamase class C family)
MAAAAPVRRPGDTFRYSNPGYALVQLLLEDVTGEPFSDWVERRVLRPLGMTSSTFDPIPTAGDAAPHRRGRRVPQGFYNHEAAGGLRATAGDLLVLATAMSANHERGRGGGVVPAPMVEEMWTSPEAARGAFGLRHGGYALGQIATVTPRGSRLVLNQGSRVGWRSLIACFPDDGQALVVLANANSGTWLLGHLGLRWLRVVERTPFALLRMRRWP